MTAVQQSDQRVDRVRMLLDVALARTTDGLVAQLREAMAAFNVRHFAVYAVDGPVALLRFSCGVIRTLDSPGESRLSVPRFPDLLELLAGNMHYVVASTPIDDALLRGQPRLDPSEMTAVFSLRTEEAIRGFVMIFGSVPPEIIGEEGTNEFLLLMDAFAGAYFNAQAVESVQRSHRRALAHVKELHDGLDILICNDLPLIIGGIVERANQIFECRHTEVWLRSDDTGWELAAAPGETHPRSPGGDRGISDDRVDTALLNRATENRRASVVNALSGELSVDVRSHDVFIASMILCPLFAHGQPMGCLVAYDTAVTEDQINAIEGVASMGAVAIEVWRVNEQRAAQVRIEEQVALAANIQRQLLPQRSPRSRFIDAAHRSEYCDETGGDYVDLVGSDLEGWHLVVGDVSGHGLGAAMLMVDARARLRTLLASGSYRRPHGLLRELNGFLAPTVEETYMTMALVCLDPRLGRLLYAGAGHEPPLLYRPGGGGWRTLGNTGLAVGMDEGERYGLIACSVAAGDILVVLTDGICETEDPRGEPFGVERVQTIVESMQEATAQQMVDAVLAATDTHRGAQRRLDDVTLLVVKIDRTVLSTCEDAPEPAGEILLRDEMQGTLEAKDRVLLRLLEVLNRTFPGHEMSGLETAIEELLSNAVRHGCQLDVSRRASVELWCEPSSSVTLVVHDDGPGFEPVLARDDSNDDGDAGNYDDEDDMEATLSRESGRGIIMVAAEVDSLCYWDGGRGVNMTKRLGSPGESLRGEKNYG